MEGAVRSDSWNGLVAEIRSCDACRAATSRIAGERPILVSPEPPPEIDILFVGVAPTALEGRNRGAHFYSSSADPLRRGLFCVLDGLLPIGPGPSLTDSNDSDLKTGNIAFRRERLHFIHACQACPVRENAPPRETIALCLERHFPKILAALGPRAVCFLGKKNLSAAVAGLFGKKIAEIPRRLELNGWAGLVAVASQPRRGWDNDTRSVLAALLRALGRPTATAAAQ